MSALYGHLSPNQLRNYRVGHSCLPGHPELGLLGSEILVRPSGSYVAVRKRRCYGKPDKIVFCLGSDGSQMEGNDAEAARLAVAQGLNVKVLIDDNNVTIAGHPSDYMPGWDVEKTLTGHGVPTVTVEGKSSTHCTRPCGMQLLGMAAGLLFQSE